MVFFPEKIVIKESGLASELELSILDIAPTMAHVLGLPGLADALGEVSYAAEFERGVMILLDGLQYEKLNTLVDAGGLPFFEHINEINRICSVQFRNCCFSTYCDCDALNAKLLQGFIYVLCCRPGFIKARLKW